MDKFEEKELMVDFERVANALEAICLQLNRINDQLFIISRK